jgi:DNA polymerase-3 subunit delta
VLTGQNRSSIQERLSELKAAFISAHGASGVETLSGETIKPEHMSSLLAGATLFAADRLVVIRDLSENKALAEQFLALLDSMNEQTHLVLVEGNLDKRTVFYKTLKKKAEIHEFAELDEFQAMRFVKESAKKHEATVDEASARLLVQYIGTDQSRLENEVAKLAAYDANITKATIEALVEKRPEETIFQLLEYALSGRRDQALGVLEGLEKAHEDPFQVASMLIWQTNILAIVHSAKGVTESDIAKAAKLNPFVVKKTKNLTQVMSKAKLNAVIEAVAACDSTLKTTSTPPWRVLEHAVIVLTN